MSTIPAHLDESMHPLWDELSAQCKPKTPASALEAMVQQLWLMRDASKRVQEEGAIVFRRQGKRLRAPCYQDPARRQW